MPGNEFVQSVTRALDMLDAVAEAGALRPGDLAEHVGLRKQTAHNLQRTLLGRGYLVRFEDGTLGLGPHVFELARDQRDSTLRRRAVRQVRMLAGLPCQPVINYCECCDDRVLVRLRMSPERPGLVQRPIAQMHNPYLTASGILFLAFLPLDGTARLREAFPFHDHATKGWRTADELEKFLKRVRKDGVCVLPFRGQELYRVAAPVLTGHGEFVSAIGAALPIRTSDEAARRSLRAAVIKAGKALGQEASA